MVLYFGCRKLINIAGIAGAGAPEHEGFGSGEDKIADFGIKALANQV